MYQVVEFVGTDKEQVIEEFANFEDALHYTDEIYIDEEEKESLGVDIMKDGSTEF